MTTTTGCEPADSAAPCRPVALHRFLLTHAFYPLLLCTVLGVSFLITRAYILGRIQYRFLVWNLLLAWVPYICSLIAVRLRQSRLRHRPLAAVVWIVWLAMFPNCPYILTDFVHLWQISPLNWWFDLGMILTFALAGCFLGIVSLRIMHDLVRPKIGRAGGWIFVTIVAALSGFGIYLGRFQRFNSWDLLTRPSEIAAQLAFLADPFSHARTYGVTFMFGAMMLVTYIMFVSTSRIAPAEETP